MDIISQPVIAPVQEKTNISIGVQTEQVFTVKRKLDLDKSISTPPSELRKQIFLLRDELTEAYEFHDLELQVLKEECALDFTESKKENKNLNDLEKSLRDAEQIILEGNREICNLKSINQDLKKKLEEESLKYEALKAQHEDEISKLHIKLKKKDLEIENLKKDKDDFDFRLELTCDNYKRKICELKSSLEKNEKEDEKRVNELVDELLKRLSEEDEKTADLSKKLEGLNTELLLKKLTLKLLQEHVADDSSKQNHYYSLTSTVLPKNVGEENGETISNLPCGKLINNRNDELKGLVIENNINLLSDDGENLQITRSSTKAEKEFVHVSVQTNEDSLKNTEDEIEKIRCKFEKEIKELKDDHGNKLNSLKCSNENLQENNLCLTEELRTANEAVEELTKKLAVSIENVDDLRRKLEEIKISDSSLNKEVTISSLQNEITEKTRLIEELETKIKDVRLENEKLEFNISNLNVELKTVKEELAALKDNQERELQEAKKRIEEGEFGVEELKLEKEALNRVIANKDEKLNLLTLELSETKNKLEESERNSKAYIKDNETYIDLLISQKAELQNWIKAREEEINNLNLMVNKKLNELKTDSELKIEELKEMYEDVIKKLKNDNDALGEEIKSVRGMYETEIVKFGNMTEDQKSDNYSETVREDENESREICSEDESERTLAACISKIKVERDSLVEIFNSQLLKTSISVTNNVKCENFSDDSTTIQQPNINEIMSLVPVRFTEECSSGSMRNYDIHTVDEENMQLKITSESTMMEFVNEFAKAMVKENVINPEELKTCKNIFYSLFSKYMILLEMYSRLKVEFDEYKVNEQKEILEIMNKTVRCLDTLCSQLEVSESSLNLSKNSFFTFQEGLPSSTILEDYTEMEISAINNETVSKDPLALTRDMTFQTPLKTPFKSGKKTSRFLFKTPLKSVSKSAKSPLKPESVKKQISRTPASTRQENYSNETRLIQLKNNSIRKDKELMELKDMYSKKIGSSEEIIRELLKSFALLEERIAKLEALSAEFQNHRESLINENADLKESLAKSWEEIVDIKDKLIVEIISLNSELEGTFSDLSVTDLLSVFLNTIMESCKKMPEELSDKMVSEMKALAEKNKIYENEAIESAKEMDFLKDLNSALIEKKERIEKIVLDRNDEIQNLRQENFDLKGLEMKMKDLEEKLAENDSVLKTEIYLKENALKDLQKLKSFFEDVEKENSNLKQKLDQSEKILYDLKAELTRARKEQVNNEMKEDELMREIEELKSILSGSEGRNNDLQKMIDNFEEEVSSVQSNVKYKACQMELLNNKVANTENLIQKRDEIIHEQEEKIAELESKLALGSLELVEFNEKYKISQTEIEQLRQTVNGYKESVNEEIESLKDNLTSAIADSTSKMGIVQELSSQLEEAKEKLRSGEETVTTLSKRVKELEGEKEQLTILQSELENCDETKKVMTDEIEQLKAKIAASETDLTGKIEDAEKLSAELKKAKEQNIRNEETISMIKKHLEELEEDKVKLESMESTLEEYKKVEKVMAEEIEMLNSKLLQAETEMKDKIGKLAEMTDLVQETNEKWGKDAELITSLKIQVQEMEADRVRLEELELVVKTLRESEKHMTEKVEDLNCRLEASENEKTAVLEKMKETELVKIENDNVISTLQKKIEDLRNDNLKIRSLEEIIEKHEESAKIMAKEIEGLNLKLASVESDLITKIETIAEMSAQLEEGEKIKADCDETISELKGEIESLKREVVNFETVQNLLEVTRNERNEKEKLIEDLTEKMNILVSTHNQEVDNLKLELGNLKEDNHNLKTEMKKLNERIANELSSSSESSQKVEISLPLKTPPMCKRNKTGESPSFISRRLERLEKLNDLLSGTILKIMKALSIPFEDNLFSVDRYEESEAQIMKNILTLNFTKKNRDLPGTDFTPEEFDQLSKTVKELRNTVSRVTRHLGLAEGPVSGQQIVDQIDKTITDLKKEFFGRIDVLRQDNQHLDDDNILLQTEMKKLVEQNNMNKAKLSSLTKSEEVLKAEMEGLRAEMAKLMAKNKTNRNNNICNRKLDKLEELHQSVVDLMKKILALTGMENLPKLNLSTARAFEIESKRVWDHFNGWVASKTKELEELKSQMKQLDEECDSYAKVIIEARQETDRVWEKSRSEVKKLEMRIDELQEENRVLQCEKERLLQKLKGIQGCEDTKNSSKTENDNERTELQKQNLSLQTRIKELEISLSQAKKQIEELDEECESYAKVIKESLRESLLYEETKNEIKELKEQAEKMEREKKCLEQEKDALNEKIRVLENSSKQKNGSSESVQGKREGKELKELKKTIALREMKILELEQVNEKNIIHKSQIHYLENSIAVLKDQLAQEELKNQKLQREINDMSIKTRKKKGFEDVDLLEQLRNRDSLGVAALHQIDDKEKLQKLEKDNRMLKEICRTRYNEIKRLETENQTLKGHERTTKNSNQMDSPMRTRCYNTRFKKN